MNGSVLFVLDMIVLILAIPACFYAWGYALQAARRADAARQDAFETWRRAGLAIADAERAQHLLNIARCRYTEASAIHVNGLLAAPLERLPAKPGEVEWWEN